jgi:endoglucanase
MDDAAGIAVMLSVIKNLRYVNHAIDIYFVATAQEEVGLRGAKTAAHTISPDIAIALDVTFGRASGLSEHETSVMGNGPAIAVGPGIHRKIYEAFKETAARNNIPHQVEVLPARTGTDADILQISGNGVVTGLLSVPVRYIHSTVETVDIKDIENCGRLIAEYIKGLKREAGDLC